MSRTDRFFDQQLKEITVESRAATAEAASELADDVQRQIRRNFVRPSLAFQKGVKIYQYQGASYVRLSPILSTHAQPTKLSGNRGLWILLPEGKRLGFKKIGKGFNWRTLKLKYANKLSIVNVSGGAVVLFRSRGGVVPVYKIQPSVTTKQRIDFYDTAKKIGNKYGYE